MTSKEPKRARLLKYGREKRVTHSALISVLREAAAEGLPDTISRSSLERARNDAANTWTPYGPLMQSLTLMDRRGKEMVLPIQAPLASLHYTLEHSALVAGYARAAIDVRPPTQQHPWKLILYFDELTIGQALRADNKRKIENIYWSINEFGPKALSDEKAWFESGHLRTAIVTKVDGQMTQVVMRVLKMFFNPNGFDARNGVVMPLPDGSTFMLFLTLGMILADYKAIVEVLMSVGAGGNLCCYQCSKVTSLPYWRKLSAHRRATTDFVPITEMDKRKWGQRTDQELKNLLRYLKHQAESGIS